MLPPAARLAARASLLAGLVVGFPSCKLVATPFRVVGSVANYSVAAVEHRVQESKQRKRAKEREKKAEEQAVAEKPTAPAPGQDLVLPAGETPGVLPPLDSLPPLPEQ